MLRDVKISKEDFYRYNCNKRRIKKNVSMLLNWTVTGEG